jgi:hypothetical protein
LTVKKLVSKNPTMKEKFESLKWWFYYLDNTCLTPYLKAHLLEEALILW